jgi:hypothetical protein
MPSVHQLPTFEQRHRIGGICPDNARHIALYPLTLTGN